MTKKAIENGETPHIRVETCEGDLVLRGWSESTLQYSDQYELVESEKGYGLSGQGDLRIAAPSDANFTAGQIKGDLVVKGVSGHSTIATVEGDTVLSSVGGAFIDMVHGDVAARNVSQALTVGEVHGDMVVRAAGSLKLKTVHGDISARRINGNVELDSVSGDASIQGVDGDVIIETCSRDVNLARVSGQVSLAAVHGDVRLRGSLEPGAHVIRAQGDIVVYWPIDAPVNLVVSSNRIVNRLPLEDVVEKKGSLIGRIGEGETNLTLDAGGRIVLKEAEMVDVKWKSMGGDLEFDFGFDLAGFGSRIENEVTAQVARLSEELEKKFGSDFGQQIAEKVARKAERAATKARSRAERNRAYAGVGEFSQPAAAKKPASTEEQLKILKMVETGKISSEEARMLLEALEL